MTSIIANRGHAVLPRLVQRINGELQEGERVELESIDATYWASVIKGMEAVVHERSGTAFAMSRGLSYRVAGKTGTAQVIGIAQDEEYNEDDIAERHRNHGLFIAFAPADKPTIALAVIVENGGGSSAAVPVAKAVLEAWMAKQAQASAQAALNG
jgi:penicillin-binding protein 2